MAGYLIGGRFLTGEVTLRRILPRSCSVELTLNAAESIRATVGPLFDPVTQVSIDLPNELIPGRDFIGWVEGDVLMAAGQIEADPFAFPTQATLNAGGMWDYFGRRIILPVLGPDELPNEVTTSLTGLSLRTIAKWLVQQARSWPNGNVPIDFEPSTTGSEEREYPGADLTKVGDALTDLTKVEGGPDITFRPKLVANGRYVRWDLLTGTPQLSQAGADHYWDLSAPSPFATASGLDRDGRDLATDVYATGSGGLIAKAENTALTNAGFPMMEAVESYGSTTDPDELQLYANEGAVRYSAHTETWSLRVKRDQNPKLGTYWPGDWALIKIGPNHRVPAGRYRVRIVRISFAETGDVSVECAPERVVGGYPVPSSNRNWLRDRLRGIQKQIDNVRSA